MGTGGARGRMAGAILLVLLVLLAVAVVVSTRHGGGKPAGCSGLRIGSWAPDRAMDAEFARYGDDGSRTDDWTGGDGDHSIRLPDGRTVWLVSDPYLDRVRDPPNAQGQPYRWRDTAFGRTPAWVRNALLVMSADGRLERTVLGGAPGAPAALFPDPRAPVAQWRWPVQAVVEPRRPGADEKVLRVLLWHRQQASGPYVYGVPLATEVATLSLPDLRLEGIRQTDDQSRVRDPGRRVLYGAATAERGGYTYVFGGGDGGPGAHAAPARAYVARVPSGRLDDGGAWRYWNGARWSARSASARPVLGDGGRRGVGSAFSVVRRGDTYVLLTMDAGAQGGRALTTITSYWACSPQGPWHGPGHGITALLPADTAPAGRGTGAAPGGRGTGAAAAYNPQAHPELGGRGLLVSYDVNWLDGSAATVTANVNRNVALYRPRFLRLRFIGTG